MEPVAGGVSCAESVELMHWGLLLCRLQLSGPVAAAGALLPRRRLSRSRKSRRRAPPSRHRRCGCRGFGSWCTAMHDLGMAVHQVACQLDLVRCVAGGHCALPA